MFWKILCGVTGYHPFSYFIDPKGFGRNSSGKKTGGAGHKKGAGKRQKNGALEG